MAVVLKFNGRGLKKLVDKQIDAFLTAATLELHKISREKASRVNSGATAKITRPRAGGNATSRTIYPGSSKPGESPKMRTTFGHSQIVWGYSKSRKAGRVGYTKLARYMTFHELGINYSKAGFQRRPTIVPALFQNQARIAAVGQLAAQAIKQ